MKKEFCELTNKNVILKKKKINGLDKYCYECEEYDLCDLRLSEKCLRQKYGFV